MDLYRCDCTIYFDNIAQNSNGFYLFINVIQQCNNLPSKICI